MKILEYMQKKYDVSSPTVLTVAEAYAFGIKYPLQHGWMKEHASRQITEDMRIDAIDRLKSRIKNQTKNGGEASPFHQVGIDILEAYRP